MKLFSLLSLFFISALLPLPKLLLVYKVLNLVNEVYECNNSFHLTFTCGDTGVICINQLIVISISQTVPSYTIWPQFQIGIGVEPKENLMFENGGYATRLASACNEDEEFDPALFSIKVFKV